MQLDRDQIERVIVECANSSTQTVRELIKGIGEDRLVDLVFSAAEARENAYAPYSNFSVGSAALTADGQVYRGWNVEAISYDSICAERAAISRIPREKRHLVAIAVVAQSLPFPCGTCRQFLREFPQSDDIVVVVMNGKGDLQVMTVGVLMPFPFSF